MKFKTNYMCEFSRDNERYELYKTYRFNSHMLYMQGFCHEEIERYRDLMLEEQLGNIKSLSGSQKRILSTINDCRSLDELDILVGFVNKLRDVRVESDPIISKQHKEKCRLEIERLLDIRSIIVNLERGED